MFNYQRQKFYNPTCGDLDFPQVLEEIFNYIKARKDKPYEIVVGCDSASDEQPTFPLALVVLRKGEGGRFFLTKVRYQDGEKKFYSFRARILEEVYLSCDFALGFREAIKERIEQSQENLNYEFQYIHADVGGIGKTKDMIKEVTGLIKSNGFFPKLKPESFAASVVADRFT